MSDITEAHRRNHFHRSGMCSDGAIACSDPHPVGRDRQLRKRAVRQADPHPPRKERSPVMSTKTPEWAYREAARICNEGNAKPLSLEQWKQYVAFCRLAEKIAEHEKEPVNLEVEVIQQALSVIYKNQQAGHPWPGTFWLTKSIIADLNKHGLKIVQVSQ